MGCNCTKNTNPEDEITKATSNNFHDSTKIKEEVNKPPSKENVYYPENNGTNETNKQQTDQEKLNIIEPAEPISQQNVEPPKPSEPTIPINEQVSEIKPQNEEPEKTEKAEDKENSNPPPVDKVNSSRISGRMSKSSRVDYKLEAVRLINQIRQEPKSFINDIEQAKSKIENRDGKLIYAGKVKVALKDGESVFNEAIEYLENLEVLEPLVLDDNISIQVPDSEEKIKQSKYLNELVEAKRGEGVSIDAFFKDSVKDYYTSVLLLIIDDSGKSKGKKRGSVLSREFTKIGIGYRKVNKTFAAYYTFAK